MCRVWGKTTKIAEGCHFHAVGLTILTIGSIGAAAYQQKRTRSRRGYVIGRFVEVAGRWALKVSYPHSLKSALYHSGRVLASTICHSWFACDNWAIRRYNTFKAVTR